MAEIIAAHQSVWECMGGHEDDRAWLECSCRNSIANDEDCWSGDTEADHAAHVAEELAKAGFGDVQLARAAALREAADWLVAGEAAGVIAIDGPSNRGKVSDAYDAAVEDPENWLRQRADAEAEVDLAALYRDEQCGMAAAWAEGRAAGLDAINPYGDISSEDAISGEGQ